MAIAERHRTGTTYTPNMYSRVEVHEEGVSHGNLLASRYFSQYANAGLHLTLNATLPSQSSWQALVDVCTSVP